MTDIAVGRAHWDELACQVGACTRRFGGAQHLSPERHFKRGQSRARTSNDDVAAVRARAPIKTNAKDAIQAPLNIDLGGSAAARYVNFAVMNIACSS